MQAVTLTAISHAPEPACCWAPITASGPALATVQDPRPATFFFLKKGKIKRKNEEVGGKLEKKTNGKKGKEKEILASPSNIKKTRKTQYSKQKYMSRLVRHCYLSSQGGKQHGSGSLRLGRRQGRVPGERAGTGACIAIHRPCAREEGGRERENKKKKRTV
jgi:hypothetical protein